jgi:hypothetical protein
MQKQETKKATPSSSIGSITMIANLIFVLLVAGSYLLVKKDMAKFSELRVQGVISTALTNNTDSLQHIYSLLAISTSKFQNAGQVDLDRAFVQPVEEMVTPKDNVVETVTKDAVKIFMSQVSTIDGLSNNGAIINGKFYGMNEIMNEFIQFDVKGNVSFEPRITGINNHAIVIENVKNKKNHIVLNYKPS